MARMASPARPRQWMLAGAVKPGQRRVAMAMEGSGVIGHRLIVPDLNGA